MYDKLLLLILSLLCITSPLSATLLFDGTSDIVVSTSVAGAPTGYPFAMVAVINGTAPGASSGTIINIGTYGTTHSGWALYQQNTSSLQIYNFGTDLSISSTGALPNATQIFVGFSSASATSHRLYAYNLQTRAVIFNETSTANLGAITAPLLSTSVGGQVGAPGVYSQFFIGSIQYVALFNQNMTGANGDAFLAMATLGPRVLANPSLLYTFNEMTGTTARDRQGTANNGVLTTFTGTFWQPMSLPGPVAY